MTIEADLQLFRSFAVDASSLGLWIFKKRAVSEGLSPFTAVSVTTTEALQAELKAIVTSYQMTYTEVEAYTLLSQPNEGGMLGVAAEQTSFPQLRELADRPQEEHLVQSIKQLNNAAGYLVRLRDGDRVLYCVRKTTNDWMTKKSKAFLNIIFKEQELDLQENPAFTIGRSFDFFAVGDSILLCSKPAFESLLSHKETYTSAFIELRQEPNFVEAFADLGPIIEYVGNNAIQLRRMAVIRARGYYNNPDYLARLRQVSEARGWGISFDAAGRIVPTAETARSIIQVLLDHRLRSELSHTTYDVPSVVAIG